MANPTIQPGLSRAAQSGRTRTRRLAAFTLVEILVAIACFLILGGSMAVILRSGVTMWREARARRVVYDRAQSIFALIAEDLNAVYTRELEPGPLTPEDQRVQVLLTCHFDESHHQRLALVRPVSELERAAGLADRGLVRVIYSQTPLADGLLELHRSMASPLDQPNAPDVLIVDDLLYLGIRFWMPSTQHWANPVDDSPLWRGPEDEWDSTRGALSSFRYYASAASLEDPADDVFPELVRVTVVVEPRNYTALIAKLRQGLAAASTGRVEVDSTLGFPTDAAQSPYLGPGANQAAYVEQQDSAQFVKIGDEWIWYERIDGNAIVVPGVGGRGARDTTPQVHSAGSAVHVGKTFTVTFRLPSYRQETDVPGCK